PFSAAAPELISPCSAANADANPCAACWPCGAIHVLDPAAPACVHVFSCAAAFLTADASPVNPAANPSAASFPAGFSQASAPDVAFFTSPSRPLATFFAPLSANPATTPPPNAVPNARPAAAVPSSA